MSVFVRGKVWQSLSLTVSEKKLFLTFVISGCSGGSGSHHLRGALATVK